MDALGGLLPFIGIMAVMFIFLILPQQRKAKKERTFAENLKRGDRVVTKSGLHGKVLELPEGKSTVTLETGAGKIVFERSAISMEMTQAISK